MATFRRQVAAGEEVVAEGVPAPDPTTPDGRALVHHDNTFGTPEEDAFRRDFTINALFYDIATFSIIDYVGGLEDLARRVVRSIGDPKPASRKIRSGCCAPSRSPRGWTSRSIRPLADAIRTHRHEIARSSPPRLIEEYYKILRAGAAERTFRSLLEVGLLEPLSAELHRRAGDELWAIAGGARRLPPPVRVDAGDADEPDRARHAARSARHPATGEHVPQADGKDPETSAGAQARRAAARRGTTSNGCARS